MKEMADSEDVYHRKYFKEKLQEKYGSSLFFAEVEGRLDVVMFRNACDTLINDEWYTRREEKNEEEAKRIIKQAAKLKLGELKSTVFDNTDFLELANGFLKPNRVRLVRGVVVLLKLRLEVCVLLKE